MSQLLEFGERVAAARQERRVFLDFVKALLRGVEHLGHGGFFARGCTERSDRVYLTLDYWCEGGLREGFDLALAGLLTELVLSRVQFLVALFADRVALLEEGRLRQRKRSKMCCCCGRIRRRPSQLSLPP